MSIVKPEIRIESVADIPKSDTYLDGRMYLVEQRDFIRFMLSVEKSFKSMYAVRVALTLSKEISIILSTFPLDRWYMQFDSACDTVYIKENDTADLHIQSLKAKEIYVSRTDGAVPWVDVHIKYESNAYLTLCFVPAATITVEAFWKVVDGEKKPDKE